jgi:hypothetical protein
VSDISIASRAHRALRHLSGYRSDDESLRPLLAKGLRLSRHEQFIGVYSNPASKAQESIVVTNFGLHALSAHGWDAIRFADIEQATIPEEKNKAEHLHLLRKGTTNTLTVPIRGSSGRARDIFEFQRFLDRVMRDQDSR